ncbi:hypothetical protein PROFUN_00761 [Planoprotostelium fungivorum]|uniref:Uncharacterized protein n=1 Tax=Planoprotostelium fungivorum TaxID=1890364 RepID=A0A2P6NUF4_9EUKA|nr:hypothetical protein PROFUN_00761 [Planoprotostelium fungivorum]
MDYDLVKTFPVKRTEPKAFDELSVSKLLNYLTRDNIFELIGFPNFSNLNEQVRQQTGKVSLPAIKKMLAGNEQFQAILEQNSGMMQQAYNKYLASNTKANDLTRQQQSKQVSWLMNKPKKQFLGVAKHTPPEVFQKCVEQYDDPDAKYEQTYKPSYMLKPPPGMKIQHLPKCIREYVSRNPSEFKDYLDEISAETKYLSLSTISRRRLHQMQETESEEGYCKLQRMQNTKIRGKKCDLNEESVNLKGLFERELTTYNNKKQCIKMNNKRYEERLQELLEEKEKEYAEEIKRVQPAVCEGKRKVCIKHALSRHKEKHKAHNNACLTTLWFSKQAGSV